MPRSYKQCEYRAEDETECLEFYESSEDPKFCKLHRAADLMTPTNQHIPRTVRVIPIENLNEHLSKFSALSIPEIVNHILAIEDQIKSLERERRAANMAKRQKEDLLTESERQALRQDQTDWKKPEPVHKKAKSPEQKAEGKIGFKAWAARLGMKVEDLMVMDDDEMEQRIATYKRAIGLNPNKDTQNAN